MVEKVKGYMFRPTEATEAKARPIDPYQAANDHFIRPIVYETPRPPSLKTWGKIGLEFHVWSQIERKMLKEHLI